MRSVLYMFFFLISFYCLAQKDQAIFKILSQQHVELPISVDHTITVDTKEGTGMNLDLSPDGKTILFDLLGELFIMPSSGGKAIQITKGMPVNAFPVWSHDGKYIAYISDASGAFRLTVSDVNGKFSKTLGSEGAPLSELQKPIWSTDNSYVICGRKMYYLSGGELELPVWVKSVGSISLDGYHMYYQDDSLGFACYNYYTGIRSKLEGPDGRVTPDGKSIIFNKSVEGKSHLALYDLCKKKSKLLRDRATTLNSLTYSVDSKTVYYTEGGKIWKLDLESAINESVAFSASVQISIGKSNYNSFRTTYDPFQIKYARYANASPDGKNLVFTALNRIYIQDISSGFARILVNQNVNQFFPVWSQDAKWIAYTSWDDREGGYLWRVRKDGGEPERLTKIAGQYHHPSWSPDASRIVVVHGGTKLGDRDFPGSGNIEIVTINTGEVKTLAENVSLYNHPSFSNDGKKVFYRPSVRRLQKGEPIIAQPVVVSHTIEDGKQCILATQIPSDDILQLRQVVVSPNGEYVVYSQNENLYLSKLSGLTNQLIFNRSTNIPVIRFAKSGIDPHWEDGGKRLGWSYGNKYYSISPEKIIMEAEKLFLHHSTMQVTKAFFDLPLIHPDLTVSLNVMASHSYGKGTIAIRKVRIITMHKTKVIEDGTVVIRDGRILALGKTADVKIPEGAKIMDLQGKTIMPGFIDLHSHMRMPPDIFPQQSWMYMSNLAYGVTTARDPSSSYDQFGYAELLKTGQMIGPRFYSVGYAIRPKYDINSLEEARLVVRNRALLGGQSIKQYNLPTRMQRQWLLMACNEFGLNMTNEAEQLNIEYIAMVKDGSAGIEHSPRLGIWYNDILTLLSKSNTCITPTVQVSGGPSHPYFRYHFLQEQYQKQNRFIPDMILKPKLKAIQDYGGVDSIISPYSTRHIAFATVINQGGHIAMGSHGEDQGLGAHFEVWALQMGGLSNLDALKVGTLAGAQALGLQNDLGSIEKGKIADLIVLDKNPLEDIHHTTTIKYIMKDGVLYEGDSLNTIWPMMKKHLNGK